jgi:hypothetical protein
MGGDRTDSGGAEGDGDDGEAGGLGALSDGAGEVAAEIEEADDDALDEPDARGARWRNSTCLRGRLMPGRQAPNVPRPWMVRSGRWIKIPGMPDGADGAQQSGGGGQELWHR